MLRSCRRHWAMVPLVVGLGAAAGLTPLAHPLFALGAWEDSQPMSVALLAAAGSCLLGLGMLAPRSRLARGALLHPLTLAPLALALWSLCTLPLAEKPWRSILGPAENGQGILWYLAMAAFVAAALVVRPARRPWHAIVKVAAATSLFAAVLGLRRIDWLYPRLAEWDLVPSATLFSFNEYLAYSALALLVVAVTWRRDGGPKAALGLMVAAVAVLLISRNRTALLSIPLIFPALFALRGRIAAGQGGLPALAAAVVAAGMAPVLVEFALGNSSLPGLETVWSRGVILRSLIPSLGDGVRHLLAGHGWGAVPDELIRHVQESGIRLYQSKWGGVERDIFHSHNTIIEALLAVGLPGALMGALLPAACLVGCDRRRLWLAAAFALCWAVLDGFWFMVPANLPLIALAAASVAVRPRPVWRMKPIPLASASVIAGLLCSAAAFGLWVAAVQESRLARGLSPEATAEQAGLSLPLDLRGDGHALANLLSAAVMRGLDPGVRLAQLPAKRLLQLQQAAERVADSQGSPMLSMALLNATTAEALAADGSPLTWTDQHALATTWDKDVRRLLIQAPERLDVLAPYLNWLVAHRQDDRLAAMVTAARRIDGGHPVVLWFEGIALLQAPEADRRAQGLDQMRRALQRGLERIMPVDAAIKRELDQPVLR